MTKKSKARRNKRRVSRRQKQLLAEAWGAIKSGAGKVVGGTKSAAKTAWGGLQEAHAREASRKERQRYMKCPPGFTIGPDDRCYQSFGGAVSELSGTVSHLPRRWVDLKPTITTGGSLSAPSSYGSDLRGAMPSVLKRPAGSGLGVEGVTFSDTIPYTQAQMRAKTRAVKMMERAQDMSGVPRRTKRQMIPNAARTSPYQPHQASVFRAYNPPTGTLTLNRLQRGRRRRR
jgi:hypothetical protein